jgi:hypothetical protein
MNKAWICAAFALLALPGVGQAHCWVKLSSVTHYGYKTDAITVAFLPGAPAHLSVNTVDGKTRSYTLLQTDVSLLETTYRWDDEPQPKKGAFIVLRKGDTLAFEGEDHTTCHLSFSASDNRTGLTVSGGPDAAKWEDFIPAVAPPPF